MVPQSLKSSDGKLLRKGRTLEEARALIEQSFGNYIIKEVKVEALEEIRRLDAEITHLQSEEIADIQSILSDKEIQEFMVLKEKKKVYLFELGNFA